MNDVAALDAAAERHETPCGAASMIWRKWGAGTPVVLFHGGSGSWTHWARTIAPLAREFEVWAADIPGLGDSAEPPDMSTPVSCAEAAAAGLRQLIPAERKPQLVCFSFGAHVGTMMAGMVGDHLRNMLIIGTAALGIKRPPFNFPKERSSMTEEEKLEVHRQVLEILMISRPDRIDDLAIQIQADNVRKARFRSRVHAGTDNVRRGLANVKVPLRTIWGAKDVVGYPDLDTVLGILREHHPELRSHIVPDAGHWVMYEQADAFNAALLTMLRDA
ncbi:MAG: alpha/beta hydrolase [Hyphomicrobiaceae bacterium]|nr:alpha/beta hydrolase [Hyphomicrobiaceae bacterium]